MGKPIMLLLLCAALYVSCDRGNTSVDPMDPMTHGSYAGSAFWSGSNFPEWVNPDILEKDAGGGGEDTTGPGKDAGEDTAECTGSTWYCNCVETALAAAPGWASADEFCACEEPDQAPANFECECCWKAFDATAYQYGTWGPIADSVCTASYYEFTPDGGCQE
jgi:hypothetical protein